MIVKLEFRSALVSEQNLIFFFLFCSISLWKLESDYI